MRKEISVLKIEDKIPLKKWLDSLDVNVKERIIKRFERLIDGNFGDCKRLDDEIFELRYDFGAGYRIYFTELDNVIVLIINGGDKSSQSKDIKKAKELLRLWRVQNEK